MDMRAQESTQDRQAGATRDARVRPSWRQRLGARLNRLPEEDGVFRPVRLPLWMDLAISAVLIALASVAFVGFFAWLARTQ